MAVAKSTKKPVTKANKTGVAGAKLKKASSKPVTAKVTKITKRTLKSTTAKRVTSKSARVPAKKSIAQRPAKTSSIKKVVSPNKVIDFVADVLKHATKAQKMANAQCKTLGKQASNLDKQYTQLSNKQSSAAGRSLQTIDKQLNRLRAQKAVIGTALLQAENNKDKIAGLVDFVSGLNPNTAPNMA